jgi:hypothetical protein
MSKRGIDLLNSLAKEVLDGIPYDRKKEVATQAIRFAMGEDAMKYLVAVEASEAVLQEVYGFNLQDSQAIVAEAMSRINEHFQEMNAEMKKGDR